MAGNSTKTKHYISSLRTGEICGDIYAYTTKNGGAMKRGVGRHLLYVHERNIELLEHHMNLAAGNPPSYFSHRAIPMSREEHRVYAQATIANLRKQSRALEVGSI